MASIGGYLPSVPAAVVGAVVYLLLSAALAWRMFSRHRGLESRRLSYMWPLLLGALFMTVGFGVRIVYHYSSSLGIYIVTTLFILLSPCANLWALYRIIGELGQALGEDVTDRCLLIRPHRISRIFVTVDILVFWVQAGGGGMTATASLAKTGTIISLIGLITQLVALSFFTVLIVVFGLRVRSSFPKVWYPSSGRLDWRILWAATIASSLGYLVRCTFRCLEYSQGYDGYLLTHELFLYLLDALPIAVAVAIFVFVWPPLYTVVDYSGHYELPVTHDKVPGSTSSNSSLPQQAFAYRR